MPFRFESSITGKSSIAGATFDVSDIFMNTKNVFLQTSLIWASIVASMAWKILNIVMDLKDVVFQGIFSKASKLAILALMISNIVMNHVNMSIQIKGGVESNRTNFELIFLEFFE